MVLVRAEASPRAEELKEGEQLVEVLAGGVLEEMGELQEICKGIMEGGLINKLWLKKQQHKTIIDAPQ